MHCTDFCPTNYTGGSPRCTPGATAIWAMTFDTFTDAAWTNNSIAATATGTFPAYERGHYFESSTPAYLALGDFQLSVRFTISGWIRPDNFTAQQTVFSKDREGTPPDLVYKAYIDTSGQLGCTISQPTSLPTTEDKTGTNTVTVKTWAFVAYAVQLKSTAN